MQTLAAPRSAIQRPAPQLAPQQGLADLMGPAQRRVIADALAGPERHWFRAKLAELDRVATAMPRTYQTDGQGDAAAAQLHYFTASADWYIVELDVSAAEDGGHHQAFGLACLNGEYPELGYISIPELLACGAELDLHWSPTPIGALKAQAAGAPAHVVAELARLGAA